MEKILAPSERWEVPETTVLERLVIAEGAVPEAPSGKFLTLTVDGVHRDLEPGEYAGRVVLSVTDPIQYDIVNYGKTESFSMNAAVSMRGGKYYPAESVTEAQTGGSVADGSVSGMQIRSEGDNFGGIYVDGGSCTIDDVDIALNGNGASDSVGFGAAISVRSDAEVTINRAKIHNVGSIRTALQVCGHGKVTVNDSEFSAADNEKPNYVMAMSKAPWMLGIHGRVRATNIQEYGEVTYNRCKITAENWGAMSTDGTQRVRLSLYDSEVRVTGRGYGAYSIGDCHDYFNHCLVHTPDYGTIQCGGALVTYTNGTQVEAGRSAVMMHGDGEPGLLTIDGGSRAYCGGPVIQVKGRGADILVQEAELVSDSGVLLEIIDNDDPNGRGMHLGPETVMDVPPGGFPGGGPGDPMLEGHDGPEGGPGGPGGPEGPGGPGGPGGPEGPGGPGGPDGGPGGHDGPGGPGGPGVQKTFPVTARFVAVDLEGDILHCYSEKNDANITLSAASLTGRITTAVSSHPAGKPLCKEQFDLIGRVEHFPCPKDTEFGLSVKLEQGSVWTVTAPSYLTELSLDEGCRLPGAVLTVDGVPTPIVPGVYRGKLVVKPE